MPTTHPQIQPFLDYLKFEKRYSQHTLISYQNDLTAFFDYLVMDYSTTDLNTLNHSIIRSWLASLKEVGMTSKSINRKISTLRSFFKHAMKSGLLESSPMAKIIAPKNEKRLPQFVADADIKTLFNHVEFPDDWMGRTERLLLLLFYNTGMRQSELIGLKESNINAASHSLKVLGKGAKERIIPISIELLNDIQEYISQKKNLENPVAPELLVTEDGSPLKPRNVHRYVKKYLDQVTTIEKRSPHVLRHSFATHLLNNGAELNAIKDLLRHSSLAATQVYTHNSIDKLKNIHKNFHPKG
jgi:integrase/recombinase XerC